MALRGLLGLRAGSGLCRRMVLLSVCLLASMTSGGLTMTTSVNAQAPPPTRSKAAAEPVAGSGKPLTILFVDDHHVLYRAGTKRVFHAAEVNAANPVVREDQPWEMAIGWTSVVFHPEEGKYQLWYQAYAGGRDARKTHKCVVCYAESDDGIRFRKPRFDIL